MPVVIPVLGVIGRFVAAKGLKKGIQKYGKKKAKEAQKQLAKQKEALAKKEAELKAKAKVESDLVRKAEEARIAQGAPRYGKQSQIRSAETRKGQVRKAREPKKDPEYYLKEYPEGIPLKFSKGGLVTFKDISKMK